MTSRRLREFAAKHRLAVAETSHAQRHLVLKGKLADLSRAFKVKFVHLEHPDHGVYRSHLAPVHVPKQVKPLIDAVMGFSARAHHGKAAMARTRAAWHRTDPQPLPRHTNFPVPVPDAVRPSASSCWAAASTTRTLMPTSVASEFPSRKSPWLRYRTRTIILPIPVPSGIAWPRIVSPVFIAPKASPTLTRTSVEIP